MAPVYKSRGDSYCYCIPANEHCLLECLINVQLYLGKNGNEGLLLNLYNYSDVSNQIWRSQTVSITDDSFSNLTV